MVSSGGLQPIVNFRAREPEPKASSILGLLLIGRCAAANTPVPTAMIPVMTASLISPDTRFYQDSPIGDNVLRSVAAWEFEARGEAPVSADVEPTAADEQDIAVEDDPETLWQRAMLSATGVAETPEEFWRE